jgi:hypothetical protein
MALTITVNISDSDETILKNSLLDIEDWVQKAVVGKINKCKKRFVAEAQQVLTADPSVETMPANADGIIAAVAARPDYKDRVARDAEENQ